MLHSGAFRRLQAKSQVVHTGHADYFRTRLTHTLEVSQIARALADRIGIGPSHLVETAALIHDLGHPPFGHNGEDALKSWMKDRGSFEANAQSFRIVALLEAKFPPSEVRGARIGLNLSRETLQASFKYPWPRDPTDRLKSVKFGYYEDGIEAKIARWALGGDAAEHKHVVAELVDIADDIAYSVHDLEDGVRAGLIPLFLVVTNGHEREQFIAAEVSRWGSDGGVSRSALSISLDRLIDETDLTRWCREPYRKDDEYRGSMKRLTSGLIDRFVRAVVEANRARAADAALVIPLDRRIEINLLMGLTWRYVIRSQQLQTLQYRERKLIRELADALLAPDGSRLLTPDRQAEMQRARNEHERSRIVCDFIAGMTDRFAQSFHARLFGADAQVIGDPL